MLFFEINPFVRYARYLTVHGDASYQEVVPLDARLFYAVDGYGKIVADGVEYEMNPSALLLIGSGVPYHILSPKQTVRYVAVNFDYTQESRHYALPVNPELTSTFCQEMLLNPVCIDDEPNLCGVVYVPQIDAIQTKLNKIVQEYTQKLLYHAEKSGHMLAEIIADALRTAEIGATASEQELASRILSYVHQHYAEDVTNGSIGAAFGYHPNYVSFLTKRVTGMPVHQYVIHVRLVAAASLLENTALSVGEVATACGFYDQAYFCKYFKKNFGVSPSKYRGV